MERLGHPVQLVPGPACNIKVTFAEDLAFVASWLSRRFDGASGDPGAAAGEAGP